MSVVKSIRDHVDAVVACPGDVNGDVLTTNWTSGGLGQVKQTERDPDEGDLSFKTRHLLEVALCMIGDLPDVDTDITTGRFDGDDESVDTTVEDCP